MQKKERVVEIYIAEDGQEFATAVECEEHECEVRKEAEWERLERKVEGYRVSFEDCGYIPFEVFLRGGGHVEVCKRDIRHAEIEYYHLKDKGQLRDLAEHVAAQTRIAKVTADSIIRKAGIKKFPCVVARGTMLGWGRELHSIYSDAAKIEKFFRVNGYGFNAPALV